MGSFAVNTGCHSIWKSLLTDGAKTSDQKRGVWVIVFEVAVEVWEAPY